MNGLAPHPGANERRMTRHSARPSRIERISLLAPTAVFLLGAIDAYGNGESVLAGANAVAGVFNVVALRFIARSPRQVQLGLFAVNAVFAFLMCYIAFMAGKKGLPYAWAVAAIVFLVVGWTRFGPPRKVPS